MGYHEVGGGGGGGGGWGGGGGGGGGGFGGGGVFFGGGGGGVAKKRPRDGLNLRDVIRYESFKYKYNWFNFQNSEVKQYLDRSRGTQR
ncbi:unnamed protein product [Pieris brassicae]|uniref:Uncharacterized protein n=1 Tax=Pieris brassicae TaxID=7116 RepID=A0A9P0TJT7_PIEBR|nr:unnamed protein product [Pieris brassicae]